MTVPKTGAAEVTRVGAVTSHKVDVEIKHDVAKRAKAGDKCVFTGTFVVVPDVGQLGIPGGNKAEMMREANRNANGAAGAVGQTGVTGLKSLGVRDLSYKTAFLACMVHDVDGRVSVCLFLQYIEQLLNVVLKDWCKCQWRDR